MMPAKVYITFNVVFSGEKYRLTTYCDEYPNLRKLLMKKLKLKGFGQCGGLGRCATCLVNIIRSDEALLAFPQGRNEMACRVLIDDELANAAVNIGS